MIGRAGWRGLVLCAALLTCVGCGFKGPLYLPERNTTVVTHTSPSVQAPAKKKTKASQSPGTPQSPTPAAPPPQ